MVKGKLLKTLMKELIISNKSNDEVLYLTQKIHNRNVSHDSHIHIDI